MSQSKSFVETIHEIATCGAESLPAVLARSRARRHVAAIRRPQQSRCVEDSFTQQIRRWSKMSDAEIAAVTSRWSPEQWEAYRRHRGEPEIRHDSFSRIFDPAPSDGGQQAPEQDSFREVFG